MILLNNYYVTGTWDYQRSTNFNGTTQMVATKYGLFRISLHITCADCDIFFKKYKVCLRLGLKSNDLLFYQAFLRNHFTEFIQATNIKPHTPCVVLIIEIIFAERLKSEKKGRVIPIIVIAVFIGIVVSAIIIIACLRHGTLKRE